MTSHERPHSGCGLMRGPATLLLGLAALGCGAPAAAQSDEQYMARMMAGGPMLDQPELDRRVAEAAAQPLGSERNPVRAARPSGQRAYLARLRCDDGSTPSFLRQGNFGPGPFASIIDGYEVDCGAAKPAKSMIYMDMYHPAHIERAAVPGYTIVAADAPQPGPTAKAHSLLPSGSRK